MSKCRIYCAKKILMPYGNLLELLSEASLGLWFTLFIYLFHYFQFFYFINFSWLFCSSFLAGDVFSVQNEMDDGWLWVVSQTDNKSGLVPKALTEDLVSTFFTVWLFEIIIKWKLDIDKWHSVNIKRKIIANDWQWQYCF